MKNQSFEMTHFKILLDIFYIGLEESKENIFFFYFVTCLGLYFVENSPT